jgi:hypothetical protein
LHAHDRNSLHADKPGSVLSVAPFSEKNVHLLETAMMSHDRQAQSLALVSQLRQANWDAEGVIPVNSTLTIDQSSFAMNMDGTASVHATVTSPAGRDTFVLLLQQVGDQWLVASTEKDQ